MPVDFERIVCVSHPAAINAGRWRSADPLGHDVRCCHERRNGSLLWPQACQHGADSRMVIRAGPEVDKRVAAIVAAQYEVRRCTMCMSNLMMGGSNNRDV